MTYYAMDNAGNVEKPNSVGLKWDNIGPTVTHTLTPAANADGWNNADVTVRFDANDDDPGSGVDQNSVSVPATISTETGGQLVTGTAKDTAGNVGTDSVTVKLDKTKPEITAKVTDGTKGNNGWYTGPVTVSFTCSDALSGVATCPDPAWSRARIRPAYTGRLCAVAGPDWLAVVDAAVAFDPLASYGIAAALGEGYYAAAAVADHLAGRRDALLNHARLIDRTLAQYLVLCYDRYILEHRWPEAEFWRRRHRPVRA